MSAALKLDVLLIGCSAGGVDALKALLPAIPRSFRPAIVVVIHLFPGAQAILSQIFQPQCALRLKEVEDKEDLVRGTVYFAPANYHVLIEPQMSLSLSIDEPVHFSRPSIDVLFESAAESLGPRVAAMLLTGANEDGAKGIRSILNHGGFTIVQDPATAEFPAMPESALKLIRPHEILSLEAIQVWFKDEGLNE